jgi:hypothetical protein
MTFWTDFVILIVLLTWMTLDRCQVYFRKPKE